jgi:hypothetical protein
VITVDTRLADATGQLGIPVAITLL